MSLKKWAVRDNSYDFIKFAATELESKDLIEHMCEKKNATYLSCQSVDEFTEAIGTYLEESTLTKIMLATDLTLSADETTIVAVFITYLDEITDTEQIL